MRHDAKASPAEAIRSAGSVLAIAGTRAAIPVSSCACDGSSAPTRRLFASLLGLVMVLALGIAASPASATYIHDNEASVAVGADGAENLTPENSFAGAPNPDLAVDSRRHRLYIVRSANPGSGVSSLGRGIFGFDVTDPSDPQPLGGRFPLAIGQQPQGYDELAVDPDSGNLYMIEKSEECFCEPGSTLYSWTPEGKPRPGYPTHIDKFGPLAIDAAGYLWVWRENFNQNVPNENLKKYLPDGTFVSELDPNLSLPNQSSPRDLVFNQQTGDLWLQYTREYVRFTADSGYADHDPPVQALGETSDAGLALDTSNGILYGTTFRSVSTIEAMNEQGEPAEDLFGVGGLAEYNPPKCGGYCPTEVPENLIGRLALDESTGAVWTLASGRIQGYFGIGAPDVHTETAIATGKTDATVAATVGPGEGPPVTACQIQYVSDNSFQKVRVVSISGTATGGRFKFTDSEKYLPYNATAAEVEQAWEVGSRPVVTGPAGGPWRIETTKPSEFGRIGEKTSVRGNELKPAGTRTHADWDASTAECEPAASGGTPFAAPTEVEAHLGGLTAGTTYHYRAVATSAAGTVYGGEESFNTTFSTVKTGAATSVDRESATLNGTVDPEGLATTYYFEYGLTPDYGSTTAAPPGDDLGTTTPGDQPVGEPIAGLQPGATYHYRLVAVNSNGTSKGVSRTFTAVAAVQGVETESATEVQRDRAMLHGKLDPDGLETHYYFEWGTSRRYGQASAAEPGTNLTDTSPGSQEVSFLATGLTADTVYHYRLVATSSFGTTYGSDRVFTTPAAVKSVVTEPATEVKTQEATLHGNLDPDGLATTYYFEYGKTSAYGQALPLPPGDSLTDTSPGSKSVTRLLDNLEPGITYHYRLVGVNQTGTTLGGDQVFTTKHPPAIESATSDNVTASSAELKGKINPHGFATKWFFEYGPTIDLGSVAPAQPGELAGDDTGHPVFVNLTGLEDKTYFFRLVAISEWGEVKGEVQTFDFAPPSCPNSAVRQQTGASYLPDCRAYELVTPSRAGGSLILPNGTFSWDAGDHFGFEGAFNAIPGTEPPNAGLGGAPDFYVATRGSGGWHTDYVGVKGNETLESRGVLWKRGERAFLSGDDQLEHFLAWESRPPERNGSYAPFMYDAEGNLLRRLPFNADEENLHLGGEEGGFRGDALLSGDGKKYVYSSIVKAFLSDGLTSPPGSAYVDDIETGETKKISVDEAGEDLQQDPLASGETGEEFIKFKAVSRDGSHVLMSLAGPRDPCSQCTAAHDTVHLYLYVRGKGTYDVSNDLTDFNRGVHYAGVAQGGSQVFFTTYRKMTADDDDQSVDLFRWDEDTNSLTRLSAGSGGSGNGDGCAGSWTTGCGVEVVPYFRNCLQKEFVSARDCGDSVIARDTGEIYFYSPEQLDGAKGVAGMRNLYVWRNGQPRFVASLTPTRPIERINVSYDGRFAAFLTSSKLTAYENGKYREIYRFDVDDGSIICISCRPDGEQPTSNVFASINGYFMTTDGRTFFATEESLVDRDANGAVDTYEYTDGRPQLISNATDANYGPSIQVAGLIGVSADGQNVFFGTFQTLVPQDENGSTYKIYDARVSGGFPYQRPAAPCAAADECHGEGNPTPAPAAIGSSADLGQRGNHPANAGKKKRKRHRAKRHLGKGRKRHARHRGHRARGGKHVQGAQKGARR